MCSRLFYLITFVMLPCLVITSTTNAELIGWWKLDDGSGTIATDSAGSNDGTLIGDTTWVDGMLDGALSFDGDGDYVDCGNDPVFDPTGSFSTTIWAYIADWGSGWGRCMFSKGGDGDATGRMGWSIRRYSDDTLCFTTAGAEGVGTLPDAEDNTNLKGNTAPPMYEWFHIACVYDVNDMAYIYINGEVDASRATTGTIVAGTGNPSVYIGTRTNTDGTAPDDWAEAWFNGMLDDARYYDNALSMEDVHVLVYGDAYKSWGPNPEDGAIEVPRDAVITWKSGLYTDKHDLYFGTKFNDVNEATRDNPLGVLNQDLDVNSFDPDGLLDWGQTYYLRVDEVNDVEPNSPWRGNVWSFTTRNYIVVEDFEDYNDFPPNEVFNFWLDGWGDATNGSTSGYPAPDFVGGEHYLEDDIVNSGQFSMPLFYDNSAGLSWATKALTDDTNWTVEDVVTLTLFFHGNAGNASEPMYVALNDDAVVTHPEPRAALINEWARWDILLQDFADQGVDLTDVGSITIGFGNLANPTAGGEGYVLFDDIRLYRSQPVEYEPPVESIDPGNANLVAYYDFENDAQDNSGNGRHGTPLNDPGYTTGATGFGSAIELNGFFHYVDLPIGSVINTLTDCTITAWVNWSGRGDTWQRVFDFGDPPAADGENPTNYMFLTSDAGGAFRFAITTSDSDGEEQTTATPSLPSGWHHVAVTIDPGNKTHTLYLDGKVVAQSTDATISPSDLGVTTQNWIGRSQWAADAYFDGAIDEFRIYNRVLSEAEILFLMGW